jgi:hypothetical protein
MGDHVLATLRLISLPHRQRQSQAKAREGPERKSSPQKGVSCSVCLALAQIDFDDKFPTIAALIEISPAPLPHFLMFCNIIPALL